MVLNTIDVILEVTHASTAASHDAAAAPAPAAISAHLSLPLTFTIIAIVTLDK